MNNAFDALKNVLLMQERIDGLRADMTRNSEDLRSLTGKVQTIDNRLIRIETMIEMSMSRGGQPPQITQF